MKLTHSRITPDYTVHALHFPLFGRWALRVGISVDHQFQPPLFRLSKKGWWNARTQEDVTAYQMRLDVFGIAIARNYSES